MTDVTGSGVGGAGGVGDVDDGYNGVGPSTEAGMPPLRVYCVLYSTKSRYSCSIFSISPPC